VVHQDHQVHLFRVFRFFWNFRIIRFFWIFGIIRFFWNLRI
jgi:hypothetical protein